MSGNYCRRRQGGLGRFIYKNKSGNRPLDAYVNSVDEVERITGIDFFPSLPDSVEEAVEAVYDLEEWQMPER